MGISPSHSLIILFPSHSGNLTISISDHLTPFAQWESHHLTLWSSYSTSHSGNLTMINLWLSYPLRTVGISPSHSLIILFPSHSENLTISLSDHLITFIRWESLHLTLWSSYSLRTVVISPSHSLIILFPSQSGNLTISLSDHLIPFIQWESHHLTLWSSYSLRTVVISPSHSLIILFPSHSGNLTTSLLDHLFPITQW